MTEQISDQISAFIDDELPDEESAFLLRRLALILRDITACSALPPPGDRWWFQRPPPTYR